MSRLAAAFAVLLLLGVARLLPENDVVLFARLAAAAYLILLPGRWLAAALGLRSTAATLVWSLAAVSMALAATFAFEASLGLALLLLAVVALAALPFAVRRELPERLLGTGAVLVLGTLFGIALWHVAGPIEGDALFHVARVRKLDALPSLSLGAVNEFADGGLHPGYAFPLWHGFLALLGRIAGVDPTVAVSHAPSVLVPLAFVAVYEAGATLFRTAAAGLAVLVGHVALAALAPAHGGRLSTLGLPGSAARDLLVPAVLALTFAFVARRGWMRLAAIAAGSLVLALVHPTYALFLLVPLVGFWGARVLLARADGRSIALALAALAVPAGAVAAALLPVVRDTASHGPSDAELERAFRQYAGQIDVFTDTSYRLAPEVLGRGGAVAVAALVMLPLCALAHRTRWAAFALGGSLAVLALMLTPWLFVSFADLVSLSQARRAAGFLPFAFAFAGGLVVLTRLAGAIVLPFALAAGIVLQIVYPGDFDYRLEHGGPALVTWWAGLAGIVALAAAALLRRPRWDDWRGGLAAAAAVLFVAPVAAQAFADWSPRPRRSAHQLTPGLVQAVRARVPEGDVVFSDLETSYRLAAFAPVYVAAAPPGHVADTVDNRPYERRRDVRAFFRTGDLAIPRRYGARWLVIERGEPRRRLGLTPTYADARYVLYRLP